MIHIASKAASRGVFEKEMLQVSLRQDLTKVIWRVGGLSILQPGKTEPEV